MQLNKTILFPETVRSFRKLLQLNRGTTLPKKLDMHPAKTPIFAGHSVGRQGSKVSSGGQRRLITTTRLFKVGLGLDDMSLA